MDEYEISQRQADLLFAIISEFIETAEAVGSISLQKNLNLDISPATIRSEMADLVSLGYLFQKSLSGGRIPTTRGMRFFVNKLIELNNFEKITKNVQLDIQSINKYKSDLSKLLKETIELLSLHSGMTAVSLVNDDIFYAGLSNLVSIPEFRDQNTLKNVLKLLEDYYTLSEIMHKGNSYNDVNVLIGEETGDESFLPYAIIFTEIRLKGRQKGYVALLGPTRMNYKLLLPLVKLTSDSIKKIIY
jgi:heat-inducible transcriptional repressor